MQLWQAQLDEIPIIFMEQSKYAFFCLPQLYVLVLDLLYFKNIERPDSLSIVHGSQAIGILYHIRLPGICPSPAQINNVIYALMLDAAVALTGRPKQLVEPLPNRQWFHVIFG